MTLRTPPAQANPRTPVITCGKPPRTGQITIYGCRARHALAVACAVRSRWPGTYQMLAQADHDRLVSAAARLIGGTTRASGRLQGRIRTESGPGGMRKTLRSWAFESEP